MTSRGFCVQSEYEAFSRGWDVELSREKKPMVLIRKDGWLMAAIDSSGLMPHSLCTIPHKVLDRAWVAWLRVKDGGE